MSRKNALQLLPRLLWGGRGGGRREKMFRDVFVIGFALFSMFFGAGNVIFPPYLGLESGGQWVLGFFCYYMADIGLALLAMFAIFREGGVGRVTGRLGRVPSALLMSAVVLCIGPMLAIPRTAASTFEMSVTPLFPEAGAALFSVLFFAIIFLLSVRESAVVDIVGKILTPALLIGLLVVILRGVLHPLGPVPAGTLVENVPANGVKAGYQTMDVLAAMVFGGIILKSAHSKGHQDRKSKFRVVAGAGAVAGAALFVVYMGLTYLGVTTSGEFGRWVNRTFLVTYIVRSLMGQAGTVVFALVVALACVTTAVALVSSSADYFSELSGGRLSYPVLVGAMCVFSAVVSNIGLDQIIAVASPILDIVYPPSLALIVLTALGGNIRNDWVFRFAALGALLFSVLEALRVYAGVNLPFLAALPLAHLGFGWVLPAVACGLAGALLFRKSGGVQE